MFSRRRILKGFAQIDTIFRLRGTMVRRAAFAGRFYPREAPILRQALQQYIPDTPPRFDAKAVLAPHAGYMYSGAVAGAVYAAVRLPRRFIILCPNHTGQGAPVAIMSQGEWETPLGTVSIDSQLAHCIRSESFIVQENALAHRGEHALEVHLPFLQYFLGGEFQFVPISVGTRRYESLHDLGRALAAAIREVQEPVLLIASSDMNHFEPVERTRAKDEKAIEAMSRLDSRELHRVVTEDGVSMCGYGPAVAVIEAGLELGARSAELVRYSHSGEVNGDYSSVVGYAGMVIC